MTWPVAPVAPATLFGLLNVIAVPPEPPGAPLPVNAATASTGGRAIGSIVASGRRECAVDAPLSAACTATVAAISQAGVPLSAEATDKSVMAEAPLAPGMRRTIANPLIPSAQSAA